MPVKATTELSAAGFKKGVDEIEKEFSKLPIHAKDHKRDMLKLEDAYTDLGSEGSKAFRRLNKEFKATGESGSKAFNRIKKAEEQAVKEAKNLNQETGKISKFAGSMKGKLAAAFGAGAIISLTKRVIDFGSALTDTALAMNIGVEQLQVLQEASTRAGAGNDILERGLRNIRGRVQEAADGNKSYNDSLIRLGLSTDSLLAMPLERRMEAFGKAYANATNQSEAFRDIQTILGERAGPKLIEVLQRLAKDGYDEVAASAIRTGQVMSRETAEMMDKAADDIEAFGKQVNVVISKIITGKPLFTIPDIPNDSVFSKFFGSPDQTKLQEDTIKAFQEKHKERLEGLQREEKARVESAERATEDIKVQEEKEKTLAKLREQSAKAVADHQAEIAKQAEANAQKEKDIAFGRMDTAEQIKTIEQEIASIKAASEEAGELKRLQNMGELIDLENKKFQIVQKQTTEAERLADKQLKEFFAFEKDAAKEKAGGGLPDVQTNMLSKLGAQLSGSGVNPLVRIQDRQIVKLEQIKVALDKVAEHTKTTAGHTGNLNTGALV